MVPDVRHEAGVPKLTSLLRHPPHQTIQERRVPQTSRLEEELPHVERGLAPAPVLTLDRAESLGDHAVTEPEGSRSKFIVNPEEIQS